MENLKPINRSPIRIYFGKKYYRIKKYMEWIFGDKNFALKKEGDLLKHLVFTHKSILNRELKDVDMWLQHNKVKSLNIATRALNKIVIRPGETLSYRCLIGNTTRRKGYVDGMVLHYGRFTNGIGGGLCQLPGLNLLDDFAYSIDCY